MDEFQAWCREGMAAGLHAVEESGRALREGDREAPESLRRLARLLHGTATTYGFPTVARAAGELLAEAPVTEEIVDELAAALRGLTAEGNGDHAEVLVIEDDPVTARVLESALQESGRRIVVARSGAEARAWLERESPALVLLDLGLPDMDGRALLLWLREETPHADVPVVVLTGKESTPARSECIALGADDYLRKPFEPESLQALARAHMRRGARKRPARPAKLGNRLETFHGLVSASAPMQEVYEKLALAAPSDVTLLLTGESGTGKEMAARALHELSRRKDKKFVAVNCSALPETLLESELFGHMKGSFTDAVRDKVGVFQSADGGTLFLDEIGDLSPLLQLKLLRVLQEREVRRVGDEKPYRVDVRLVAATNRDLRGLLATRAIRDDFYYRIRVFEVRMPALRERREDVPVLVKHFLEELEEAKRKSIRGVTREALAALSGYPWPGNVRELRNALEHALVTVRGGHLELADLPDEIRSWVPRAGANPSGPVRDETERARILAALAEAGGHRARAARLLGISRITLWKKLRRLGVPAGNGNGAQH